MGSQVKPLNIIYWSRVGFGIVAAIMCTILGFNLLLNGMTIAILVYIVTYYILKALFMTRVEKLSKVFTMGIGAYFLSWIVAWVLLLTVMRTL
jgi:hypothetical protein